jgi:hypothetical protein
VTQRTTEAAPTRAQNISRAMQQKWQDPDYRQKQALRFAERRQDPTKSWSRRGIPNGYTRDQADLMWRECRAKAEEDVRALEEREGEPMHPYAREALEQVITIMRSALNDAIRLRAARLLLEFTVGKPREHRSVSLETAEWWLDQLTA